MTSLRRVPYYNACMFNMGVWQYHNAITEVKSYTCIYHSNFPLHEDLLDHRHKGILRGRTKKISVWQNKDLIPPDLSFSVYRWISWQALFTMGTGEHYITMLPADWSISTSHDPLSSSFHSEKESTKVICTQGGLGLGLKLRGRTDWSSISMRTPGLMISCRGPLSLIPRPHGRSPGGLGTRLRPPYMDSNQTCY